MVGRAGRVFADEFFVASGCALCRQCHGGSWAMFPIDLVMLAMLLSDAAPAMTGVVPGVSCDSGGESLWLEAD